MLKVIRKSFGVARTELLNWLHNPRIMLMFMLVIVIYTLAVEPLIQRAEKTDMPLNVFEPMIAVGNSGLLALLMPSVFMVLISDYPPIKQNSMLYVIRIGKKSWFYGQLLFAFFSIVIFIGGIFLIVGFTCANGSNIDLKWSESTRKFIFLFPEEANSFVAQLLPSNLYNQLSLSQALSHTFVLLALYFFTLALVLMLFVILNKRSIGLLVTFLIILCGVVTCSVKSPLMWCFPMGNSIIWLHYTEIMKEPIYPIWCSYLYFIVIITVLLTTNRLLVKKINFDKTEE